MQTAPAGAPGMDHSPRDHRPPIPPSVPRPIVAVTVAGAAVEVGVTGTGVVAVPSTMTVIGTGLPPELALKRGVIGTGMTVIVNAITATLTQIFVHEIQGMTVISVTVKHDPSRKGPRMNRRQRRRTSRHHPWRLPRHRSDLFLIGQHRQSISGLQ